jgi:ArsR family transcriptional regulator
MSVRPRPVECCVPPRAAAPLPEDRRDALVAVLRALGEPTRLEMFRLIAAQPAPICVCDVVDRFDLQQPTISHHLKVLREAGLVSVSRRGVWAYYAVEPGGLELLRGVADSIVPELAAAT